MNSTTQRNVKVPQTTLLRAILSKFEDNRLRFFYNDFYGKKPNDQTPVREEMINKLVHDLHQKDNGYTIIINKVYTYRWREPEDPPNVNRHTIKIKAYNGSKGTSVEIDGMQEYDRVPFVIPEPSYYFY